MRRALAAMLSLLSVPALAAIETTTITGTVYAPDGSVATGGSITCALTPTPGRASDGTNLQVVASRYVATISGTGTVSFALVPNDVISPAGTVYACTYTITGPLRSTFTESWSVTTAPDPVSIGAIARVGGPTLTLPTVSGADGSLWAVSGSGMTPVTEAIYAPSTDSITTAYSYERVDSNGDGTVDLIRVGDADNDGTLELGQDFFTAVSGYVDEKSDNRHDTDGDGTADSLGMSFVMQPGKWTFLYSDRLTIRARGGSILGYGAYLFPAAGTCSGGANPLDDLDDVQDFRTLFLFACTDTTPADSVCDTGAESDGSDWVIAGFSADGGSDEYIYSNRAPDQNADGTTDTSFCYANNLDNDANAPDNCPCDASDNTVPCTITCATATSPAPCGPSGRHCPLDEAYLFNTDEDARPTNLTFRDITASRWTMPWEMSGATAGKKGWTFDNVTVKNSGEEGLQTRGNTVVVNSKFERCGAYDGQCITLGASDQHSMDVRIANNSFVDCIGECIALDVTSTSAITPVEGLVIEGNTYRNTTAIAGAFISLYNAGASANPTMLDVVIANNTADCTGIFEGAACITVDGNSSSAYPFTGGTITGNRIKLTADTGNTDGDAATGAHAALFLNRVSDYTVTGNTITVTPDNDTSCGGGNEDRAFTLANAFALNIANNDIKILTNQCSVGIYAVTGVDESSIVGNNIIGINEDAATTRDYGIRATALTRSAIQSNRISRVDQGIFLAGTSPNTAVIGNYLYDLAGYGIRISGTGEDDASVIGNVVNAGPGGACYANDTANNDRAAFAWNTSLECGGSNIGEDNRVAALGHIHYSADFDDASDSDAIKISMGPQNEFCWNQDTDNNGSSDYTRVCLQSREATASRTVTISNATGQIPQVSSSTSVGVVLWSTGTDTTLDTGTLVCADRDLVCVDVYTPAGDTTNTCSSDFGSGVPFYAVCRGN